MRGVLRPAFKMAVDDDLIRKSPFDFELASVIVNDSHTGLAGVNMPKYTYIMPANENEKGV